MDFKKILVAITLIFQVFVVWGMESIPKDRKAMYDKIWAKVSKDTVATKAEYDTSVIRWDKIRAKQKYVEKKYSVSTGSVQDGSAVFHVNQSEEEYIEFAFRNFGNGSGKSSAGDGAVGSRDGAGTSRDAGGVSGRKVGTGKVNGSSERTFEWLTGLSEGISLKRKTSSSPSPTQQLEMAERQVKEAQRQFKAQAKTRKEKDEAQLWLDAGNEAVKKYKSKYGIGFIPGDAPPKIKAKLLAEIETETLAIYARLKKEQAKREADQNAAKLALENAQLELKDLQARAAAAAEALKAFRENVGEIKTQSDEIVQKIEAINQKIGTANKSAVRVNSAVDHLNKLAINLMQKQSETIAGQKQHEMVAEQYASLSSRLVDEDAHIMLCEVNALANELKPIKQALEAHWKNPDAELKSKSKQVELTAFWALEGIQDKAYQLAKTNASKPINRDLFEKIYSVQVEQLYKGILEGIENPYEKRMLSNVLRVVTYKGLSAVDCKKYVELDEISQITNTAQEIAKLVKVEFEEAQKVVGVSSIATRALMPLGTMFDEAGQILDLSLGNDKIYTDVILEYSLDDTDLLKTNGLGVQVEKVANDLECELLASGIILDPVSGEAGKLGVEDIKTYTGLTDRVHASLQKRAKDNPTIQAACNTNSKLNDMAMIFAMNNDLEDAAVVANFTRSFAVGLLKRGSYVATHKWEFTKQLFGGVVNAGIFLVSEYSKYQELDDAFWTFDADRMDATAQAYVKDCQAQAKAFGVAMDKIKAMTIDEVGESLGAGGFDFIVGAVCFKALGLFAKGVGVEVLERSYSLSESVKAERALAEATNTAAATTEAFNTLPVVTKVTMEEGVEAVQIALNNVAKNPEFIQADCNFAKAVKKVANAANEHGKAFEELLVKKLGGKGSFKAKSANYSREFDGAIGNVWYEAKSGRYWDMALESNAKLEKFRGDMLRGLDVAKANGATYELYSETPIPQELKAWLTKHGIPFKEFLEGE